MTLLGSAYSSVVEFLTPNNILKPELATVAVLIGLSSTLLVALKPKFVYIVIKTLPRDIRLLWMYARLNIYILYLVKTHKTVAKLFRKTVEQYPTKIAFYYEDETWTFQQIDDYTNKIGTYFKKLGYKKGDSIALMMDSRPEFVCLWLGLAKAGIITALINTNLKSKEALAHAIRAGKSETIIFGSRFKALVKSTKEIFPELKTHQYNDELDDQTLIQADDLKTNIEKTTAESLDADIDSGKSEDTLIYIYTSGTTGLPKASVIKNSRYVLGYLVFNLGVKITAEDVVYIPVPLYHTLGGMTGVSQCLLLGASVVIKKKFSASNFWKDCERYQCTASQYIGELARYVIMAHKNTEKPTYKLNKMYGNGMKPTTWKQFIEAFNVGQICEFYGSTEGNFGLFNLDNTVGSVGYVPVYGDFLAPLSLIRCNARGEPIRDSEGRCQKCEYGEAGLLVCRISNLTPLTKFDGYSDQDANKKKLLKGVFRSGDTYFNTGDVLIRDDHGYYYFKDRTGDTFRWKGENVSTVEVEDILSSIVQKDVALYGVEVPGNEGKAGMAAIVDPENTLDLKEFLSQCQKNLPSYSIPIFLRIVDEIPKTGTFKMQKVNFSEEGFNTEKVKDKLYFLDPKNKEYVILDSSLIDDIKNCKVRV